MFTNTCDVTPETQMQTHRDYSMEPNGSVESGGANCVDTVDSMNSEDHNSIHGSNNKDEEDCGTDTLLVGPFMYEPEPVEGEEGNRPTVAEGASASSASYCDRMDFDNLSEW